MSEKIIISVNGQPRELEADYLSPAALEYWRAWLANEARQVHNPFEEFAAKVQVLPPELQAVATQAFTVRVNFDEVPKVKLMETAQSPRAIFILSGLVTGESLKLDVQESAAAFVALIPFVQRQEIACASIEEAKR